MEVSQLLEACQWDYCACTTSLSKFLIYRYGHTDKFIIYFNWDLDVVKLNIESIFCLFLGPEECACRTVSVYAKECLRHGVEEMRSWRDSDTCRELSIKWNVNAETKVRSFQLTDAHSCTKVSCKDYQLPRLSSCRSVYLVKGLLIMYIPA